MAFRSAVVDSAAIGFAATFYRHLPVVPVDVAVSRARARLAATDDFDWTQPILYARTERLRLCEVGAPASHPMNPRSGGTTFRNTDVRIGGKLRQIGGISSGEGAGSSEPARPVEFINDRVEVRGDAEQIGEVRVGAGGKTDFGARWRELLSVVSEEES